VSGLCCNTSCNNTTCDWCAGGGWCQYFSDPNETYACPNSPWLGNNHFSAAVWSTIQNFSDGDDWYRFYASDDTDACFWPIYDYGHLRVWLDMPAGTDYDLELYKANNAECGALTLIRASRNGGSTQDYVDFQEDCGGGDDGFYVVRVLRYSGYTCSAQYKVTVSSDL
jgi:hypothetical protein